MRQFFTLLCRSPYAVVRANMMIAAGDLLFRYPNIVEPYSHELYKSLEDHMHCAGEHAHVVDQCVRQNCLLVLTHLILNGMLKVHPLMVTVGESPRGRCRVGRAG